MLLVKILLIVVGLFLVSAGTYFLFLHPLFDETYAADEAMGAQEWQVPEEERKKGYR